MMRKTLPIALGMAVLTGMISCKSKESPGRAYMPDMAYSRAYETYASLDTSKFTMDAAAWSKTDQSKIFYNALPVAGTMARGDMSPYPFKNDSTGYAQSTAIKNPLQGTTIDIVEAERLYLVNCAICHGSKLDGMGPLYKGGDGPFTAAPKNLMADDMKALSEGTMYHVITYGKGQMGSYASQLSSAQRWMVISYIRNKQGGAAKDTTAASTTITATADTAAAKAN